MRRWRRSGSWWTRRTSTSRRRRRGRWRSGARPGWMWSGWGCGWRRCSITWRRRCGSSPTMPRRSSRRRQRASRRSSVSRWTRAANGSAPRAGAATRRERRCGPAACSSRSWSCRWRIEPQRTQRAQRAERHGEGENDENEHKRTQRNGGNGAVHGGGREDCSAEDVGEEQRERLQPLPRVISGWRLGWLRFEQRTDDAHQLAYVERLAQEDAVFDAAANQIERGAGGEEEHDRPACPRIGAQAAIDLGAIEAGQAHVEEHHIRRRRPGQLERACAFSGEAHVPCGITLDLKRVAHDTRDQGIVLDDEDVAVGRKAAQRWLRLRLCG